MNNKIKDLMSSGRIRRWMDRPNHCVTIGVLSRGERLLWSNGNADPAQSASIYEIGSVTKTMTGLLFAIGELEGIWSRNDKLADYDPEWSSSPFAQQTSLLQLLTHTSGLPRMPANFNATIVKQMNPYASYRNDRLIEAVASERPKDRIKHDYSNYGFGLLGWLMAGRLGKSLDEALQENVFTPLGMTDTAIGLHPAVPLDRLLPVYTAKGKPVPHWDFLDTMSGAGGVRSTVMDLLRYLEAYLNKSVTPLSAALNASCEEHYAIYPSKGIGVGYGWMRKAEKDGSVTHWHNGGTYGSSSFAAFNRDHDFGLVVLSNYGIDIWSQLAPLIGIKKISVDTLAGILSEKLMGGVVAG